MRTALSLIILAAATSASVPAVSAPGGRLGTLPLGEYRCALPGDAAGPAWRPLDARENNFRIGNSSTYRTVDQGSGDQGSGTYLLTGDNVTFTRGPLNGRRFVRNGSNTLRLIGEDGKPGDVRCVRTPRSG